MFYAAPGSGLQVITSEPRSVRQPAAQTLLASGRRERAAGQMDLAVAFFRQAADQAQATGDIAQQASALNSISGCKIRLFDYREALSTAILARQLATRVNDYYIAGSALGNITSIYSQLGDFSLAARAAQQSVDALSQTGRQDALARALTNLADNQIRLGNTQEGRKNYARAIAAAQDGNFPTLEALAWNYLALSLLDSDQVSAAETALVEAYRMGQMAHASDQLMLTRASFATLAFRQGRYEESLKKLDAVRADPDFLHSAIAPYQATYLRGEILVAMGKLPEALVALENAVQLAAEWRAGALPGEASDTYTVARLHRIFNDYVLLAASLAIKQHDNNLARKALEVLSDYRAVNLREQIESAYRRENRLPPEYFSLLAQLKTVQVRATLNRHAQDERRADEIRLQLREMDDRLGLRPTFVTDQSERKPYQKSLRTIQDRLGDRQVLFSFCLGDPNSFVWAVTRKRVALYELPEAARIDENVSALLANVRENGMNGEPARWLQQHIFQKFDAHFTKQPEWLIVPAGSLSTQVPFSAMLSASGASSSGERSIRLLPCERLLTSPARANVHRAQQTFVGVGDPIYNLADSRRSSSFPKLLHLAGNERVVLARLPGSQREIGRAAALSVTSRSIMLIGADATGIAVEKALEQQPGIIHFAVHVVSPEHRPNEAALALSLTQDGMPELLTPELIATFRVPGSLVVLSGCSSAQGEALPGAGLMGLSRAWLLAGAEAIVASAWPTPDDSGQFFSSFYRHYQELSTLASSVGSRAARALERTQIDMRQSGTYRSAPSFWAAYSVISKE